MGFADPILMLSPNKNILRVERSKADSRAFGQVIACILKHIKYLQFESYTDTLGKGPSPHQSESFFARLTSVVLISPETPKKL